MTSNTVDPRATTGRLLLLVTVVVWGWSFVATKICLEVLSPVEVIGFRMAFAVPVLAVLVRVRRARIRLSGRLGPMVVGSALLTVHFLIQVTGLRFTSAVHTGWIIAVTPLVLAVLARLLLGEAVGRRTAAGVAVATAGILLLVSGGRPGALGWQGSIGDWLVLASAHTWALYTLAIRDAARTHDPLALTLVVVTPTALVTLGWMVATTRWRVVAELSAEVLVALVFLGVLSTAVAHWFWQEGVARVGAAEAGTFLYLEPVATTVLAVPYLGEHAGPSTLLGGALVLTGVWIAQRRRVPRRGEGARPSP